LSLGKIGQVSSPREVHMKTLADSLHQQDILNRIAKLSSGDVAKWGRMPVHQMICHLSDAPSLRLAKK
jgi:hypothetical protein